MLPLFSILGYSTGSASEVKTEFPIDKGRNQDYVDLVIMRDGKPCIAVECKKGDISNPAWRKQLKNYFQNLPDAKFGVLTNGVKYQFFSDKDQTNVMEEKPFFEFDVTDLKDTEIEILRSFYRGIFDLGAVASIARERMRTAEIQNRIRSEMANPSEAFVRYIAQGFMKSFRGASAAEQTKKQFEQLQSTIRKAFEMVVQETVSKTSASSAGVGPAIQSQGEMVTTEEKVEGYHTVRAMLHGVIDLDRVICRDMQSYFAISLDNKWQPVCRLYFNSSQKYVGIFDENKKEIRFPIANAVEVACYKEAMIKTVQGHEEAKKTGAAPQSASIEESQSEPKEYPYRTWTTVSGSSIDARFVGIYGNTVQLQRENGSFAEFPKERLSVNDLKWIDDNR
ncbi:MAG: type I restriction enzyme HsdR N-terminal domain-containing protein [Planctomycetaceae bacterium]|nr:type I restriction enzyme HsdR N-terminal domain-containing protein [Planctomycetaceae bacterium]